MIELERACLLNTHNVPAPIKHRENMRPALGILLTPETELDNHDFGLTKRTTGFSLPIEPHPRLPSLDCLPGPRPGQLSGVSSASLLSYCLGACTSAVTGGGNPVLGRAFLGSPHSHSLYVLPIPVALLSLTSFLFLSYSASGFL